MNGCYGIYECKIDLWFDVETNYNTYCEVSDCKQHVRVK